MIHVEQIYFKEDELIRANSLDSGYDNFMIMSTESPTRYGDFITVNVVYIGDTDYYDDTILTEKDLNNGAMKHYVLSDDEEKLVDTAKEELKKTIGEDGEGYVYVCRREDDEFAIGICTSPDPLKKATEEEWLSL